MIKLILYSILPILLFSCEDNSKFVTKPTSNLTKIDSVSNPLGASSVMPFTPTDMIAESFHFAIALEKLDEVRSLFNRDTIFVRLIEIDKEGNQNEGVWDLPYHVDKWIIYRFPSHSVIKNFLQKDEKYLLVYFKETNEGYTINIICQPFSDNYIDRAGITFEFIVENKTLKLKYYSKWYG